MLPEQRMELLEKNLSRQLHWIAAADAKAAFAFTLSVAMLAVLLAVAPKTITDWTIGSSILAAFAGVLGFVSLLFVSFTTFPRTSGPRGSLIFFGGVAERDAEQFYRSIQNLSCDEYMIDLCRQCHRNAEIAKKKYTWVQRSLFCLYLSVVPWGLAVYTLYV